MTPPGTQSPPQHPQPSAAAPSGAAPIDSSLDSQIDALLSDAAAPGNAAPKSAAADAEAAVASIEKQVESLVDQFVEQASPQDEAVSVAEATQTAPGTFEPGAAAESSANAKSNVQAGPPPESIGALDDQLARLTDELLTAPAPETYQAPSVKFAPTPNDQVEPAKPENSLQTEAASAVPTAAAPVETPKPVGIPIVAPSPAGPNKLVQALAKPLAGKPRLIRDTVGWLGFNSMFLAGVVWSYHLWFQRPEKLVAEHSPVALVASDGHGDTSHGEAPAEGHGAPAGGEAHASAEHGSEGGGEHASAATDSDEPITGVNPLHKKKPTYALSDAMAEKLNVAKKAEAGHGGGGGGHGAEKKSSSGHGAPPKSGH